MSLCLMALVNCSTVAIKTPPLICNLNTECGQIKMPLKNNGDLLKLSLKQQNMIKHCQLNISTLKTCIAIYNNQGSH